MGTSGSDTNRGDQPQGGRGQRDTQQPAPQQPPGGPGQRPPGNGGGMLSDEESKQYLFGLIGTLAVLSVTIFVMILLLGSVGGPSLTVDQDLSSQQEDQLQDVYKFGLVQTATGIAPYLGLVVAAFFGLQIGSQLSKSQQAKLKLGAVSGFVGVSVFVFLTIFLASTQMPDLSSIGGAGGGGVATGTSLDAGQLLLNSVVFGAVASIVTSGAAYFGDRMA